MSALSHHPNSCAVNRKTAILAFFKARDKGVCFLFRIWLVNSFNDDDYSVVLDV